VRLVNVSHFNPSLISVTRKIDYNLAKFLEKVAKKCQKYTPKLNFKVRNMSIKPHFIPSNTYNKPCVETACLGGNWLRKK
jgi:hypothetical protein